MITKTKILIGILIAVIIAGGGWWICNQTHKPIKQEMTCDERCKSLGYISGTCRKFTTLQEEAKKCKENEVDIGRTWDCVSLTLVAGTDATCCCKVKEEVTIATDKTEYEVGELVKIIVRNNLDKDVCYFTPAGGACYKTPYTVYQFFDEKWESLRTGDPSLVCIQVVRPPVCEEIIKSKESIEFTWNQKIMEDVCPEYRKEAECQVSSGKYKISLRIGDLGEIYSNEFTIKEKINETADWKTYRNEEIGIEFKYPKEWNLDKCIKLISGGGVGASAIWDKECRTWIDFVDESFFYKFPLSKPLADYFCNKDWAGYSPYSPNLLDCRDIEIKTGQKGLITDNFKCYAFPCPPEGPCGDVSLNYCEYLRIFYIYLKDKRYPIFVAGKKWGQECFEEKCEEFKGTPDLGGEELFSCMQDGHEFCKKLKKAELEVFNRFIKTIQIR